MRSVLLLAFAGCAAVGDPLAPDAPSTATPADSARSDTSPVIPATMQAVPGGIFMMGCNASIDSSCDADELPYHAVDLDSFEIDTTEVTAAHYAECTTAGSCAAPAGAFTPATTPNVPVVFVRWDDAVSYCAWRGKRLPTEAEWEKAARGTDGRVFPWGDSTIDCTRATIETCGNLGAVATHPDGASPYGVLDVSGNAWEWVADKYDAEYYQVSPASNPKGTTEGDVRTIRGGSFAHTIADARASNRSAQTPFYGYPDVGFRCAKSL